MTYLLGYSLGGRFSARLRPLFRGCDYAGSGFLAGGLVLGVSSLPALAFVLGRYPHLLTPPDLISTAPVVLGAAVAAGAAARLWSRLVSGVTLVDYYFIEALRCRRVPALILAYFAGPVLEEVVYRGLIQYSLIPALGAWAALVIVSAAFAAPHISLVGVKNALFVAALSMMMGVLMVIYDSLIPPIVIHVAVNIGGTATCLKTS